MSDALKNAKRRMALRMAALTAPMMMMGGDPGIWNAPKDLASKKQTYGYQGKGHHRRNWEQKKTASNHRVAKRRAKNKASRLARKKQRR